MQASKKRSQLLASLFVILCQQSHQQLCFHNLAAFLAEQKPLMAANFANFSSQLAHHPSVDRLLQQVWYDQDR